MLKKLISIMLVVLSSCVKHDDDQNQKKLTVASAREQQFLVLLNPKFKDRLPGLVRVDKFTNSGFAVDKENILSKIRPKSHLPFDTVLNLSSYRDKTFDTIKSGHINNPSAPINIAVYDKDLKIYHQLITGNLTTSENKDNSYFKGVITIEECIFNDKVGLETAPGLDLCRITDAIFYQPVHLLDNQYKSPFSLLGCYFRKGIYFQNSFDTIRQKISITDCRSDLFIQFHGVHEQWKFPTHFAKDLVFDRDSIIGKIDLSGLIFLNGAKLVFQNSTLPSILDMSDMQLSGKVDLTGAYAPVSAKKCEINLLNTDIEKVKLSYTNFHLFFPNHMADSVKYKDVITSVYQSLLNNLKKNGFNVSYKKLDIEFKTWQSKTEWLLIISDAWWKYGYEKWRIIIFSLAFIVLFSFVNMRYFSKLQSVYKIANLNRQMPARTFSNITKKYFAVLLYTGLIFFSLGLDFKSMSFKPMRYACLLLLEYTIGLICTGFLIHWIIG